MSGGKTQRPWAKALEAHENLDVVADAAFQRLRNEGVVPDDIDKLIQIANARSTMALADAIHLTRQELTLTNELLGKLVASVEALVRKFPAL
jgi:3-oxoacyl-[acyl-carrier-protein] synthase III